MASMKSVLFVEDEELLTEAVQDKLTRSGYTVYVAKNGIEGLEIAQSKHPDCILLDVIMPKMHGLEMLKRLRAESWGTSIPVFIFTNLSSSQDVEEAKKYNVRDFIIKAQCPLDELVQKIHRLFTK